MEGEVVEGSAMVRVSVKEKESVNDPPTETNS